jgi:Na+-translocating ferredoxin:NAD+ oxidoreductase subunit D
MEHKLTISSSPHVHGTVSTSRLMWTVVAALMPATLWSFYLFGLAAVSVTVSTILFCVLFEALAQALLKQKRSLNDGSSVLSGLILALTLPPGLPIWICAIGALVAMVIAKAVFGGLGQNPFNPAMTGRVFLLIAFPQPLTQWMVPRGTGDTLFQNSVTALDAAGKAVAFGSPTVDVVTAATPLGLLAKWGETLDGYDAMLDFVPFRDLFIGHLNGSLGETSALFLLLGGLFLIIAKVITWHIPVACLVTIAVFGGLFGWGTVGIDGALFHLLSGGAILGAFFIATDYVTSPLYPKGKLIFGAGVGILTMVIRLWAGYPEGVSFAVLLMNATVPILDRYTKPVKFGFRHLAEEGGK